MTKQTLLVELGTEELPPKSLKRLRDAFAAQIITGLSEAELVTQQAANSATSYATPRRLALTVPSVTDAQPDQTIERRGPAVQAAFDQDGEPTQAAVGFAKSCGVAVGDLQRLQTEKGEWLSHHLLEKGKTLAELLPGIIDNALQRLPIAKRMRWGDGRAEFVRPIRWSAILHGDAVVPINVLDVASSNTTRGHRFHCTDDIVIDHADHYASLLLDQGQVIADFDHRQAMIIEQINATAAQINGEIPHDQSLLDEVTGLVEYPVAVLGNFDPHFLNVPQECLISSMRDHQKYFHVVDADGALMANFVTVSNIQSKNPAQVREGNEKVLRARLSDAQFFWTTDQKTKLVDRVEKLGSVLFHNKLGSVLGKTERMQELADQLAKIMSADQTVTQRGALLAKADLVSDMVGEFDDLQGTMGRYYATHDGEDALVGECIEQHYWPKFAGDRLPVSAEAQAVALADKLDSLVGIYSAGEIPTGDKDPHGLRRSALGILRILIEQGHAVTLTDLVTMSSAAYAKQQSLDIDDQTQAAIIDFIRGRLVAFYQGKSVATSIINSVMACKPDSPLDFDRRVTAVNDFSKVVEAADLVAANKRIGNLLKKQTHITQNEINQAILTEEAEITLFSAVEDVEADCLALFEAGDYSSGLNKLAHLRTPVDRFFDQVMVMTDDPAQRQNRLALLKQIQSLFLRVADISLLQL